MEREFVKYQHIERFGTTEVQGIELGECYIFPKIDGTNASVWLNDSPLYQKYSVDSIQCGSRNRQLSLEKDNAGFCEWANNQHNLLAYLIKHPTHRLFGEWLVPHSLKTYRENAWKRFYVFDVMDDNGQYLHYEDYAPLLQEFDIDYIPPLAIITNASYEQFIGKLNANVFLIEDGKGCGEGIVIKNYNYVNKYGRTTWAKIVTSEFKEKHAKTMGAPKSEGKKMVEEEIVKKYVTTALCEKVKSKIENDNEGFSSRDIPRLLNTVYYDLVNEESWNFVKEHRNPTINFKTLQHLTIARVKQCFPEIF